jgi:ATP-dependent DNA ligase
VGFEPEGKSRIAALHLAKKGRGSVWSYVGKVGTGFSAKVGVELRKKIDELVVEKPVVALGNASTIHRSREALSCGQSRVSSNDSGWPVETRVV